MAIPETERGMGRELIERARNGDAGAFSEATRSSIARLYAVATLILRDEDRAQDAVQEALVAAWRGIRALRELEAWDAWLHRCVVRACYRQAKNERTRTIAAARVAVVNEPTNDDASLAIASRDELDRAFRDLSVDHRTVVVLHYFEDRPVDEVAEVLGIPEGTVKSRLHRATNALRAALEAGDRYELREERSA
jgi:RNA polymerase sigma-70 factor, ECF subfamily